MSWGLKQGYSVDGTQSPKIEQYFENNCCVFLITRIPTMRI